MFEKLIWDLCVCYNILISIIMKMRFVFVWKMFLGWLGESLVLSLWVPIGLSVPESHHPLARMWCGHGSRLSGTCRSGMVLGFRGRATVDRLQPLRWGVYSFSRDRPFAGPSISLTSNGGATHGFYDKMYFRFMKWFWMIAEIRIIWNFHWMCKYVIFMIIWTVIMGFDYTMTLITKSDDWDMDVLCACIVILN